MKMRSSLIDIKKGILVLGMLLAHCIQFFYSGSNLLLKCISEYANLVTFSGFFFCFGYVSWLAYFKKENLPVEKMLKTAFKCYVAFVLSGVVFKLFVEREGFSYVLVESIILLQDIPGYSEFLISFSVITLLSLFLSNQIEIMTRNFRWVLVSFSILIFSYCV